MSSLLRRRSPWGFAIFLVYLTTLPATALTPPKDPGAAQRTMRRKDLYVGDVSVPASRLRAEGKLGARLADLGVAPERAWLDVRTGRFGTLLPQAPLLPGSGNGLSWAELAAPPPQDDRELADTAWQALVAYLDEHRASLAIDPGELETPGHVTVHRGGELVQVHAPRRVDGIAVEGCYLTAVVSHGNLVLLGARNWGDVPGARRPEVPQGAARDVLRRHLEPWTSAAEWRRGELVLVPVEKPGPGLGYRLAWSLHPEVDGGRFRALVDAQSGELLLFADSRHWASPVDVRGGVLPVSSDGTEPDGVEQAGTPMPFADLTQRGETRFADRGGNVLTCIDGVASTTLAGPFLRMFDLCGAVNTSGSGPVLDLGQSIGTDCAVVPGSASGNTRASRSGYYEIGRIQEMARAQLPANTWLTEQLTANMNLPGSCNAFWSGNTVNFYRSGGGCANTGELAGVFDHEWGHGLDDNDAAPFISNPGEGIADVYASLRLDTSCIGRGFFPGLCSGYGDPCTECTGVRDVDWAKRVSGAPHGISGATGIDDLCPKTLLPGPCGGSVHCEGAVYAEAVWDLWNRDLEALYGMSRDTARELAARLTFVGAGLVGQWFNCADGTGTGDGCNADGGYLNYLVADDDNGDLGDGTPHMKAIHAAFDRHEIACAAPAVRDSGCAGAPASAPAVTAVPGDRSVALSWDAVAGASSYRVYHTEGVFGCDFGKVLVGETSATSFLAEGLANGFEASFVVVPMGAGDTCFGPASACVAATPAAGARLALKPGPLVLTGLSGDGDDFVDNCEATRLCFEVENVGTETLTGLRLAAVESSAGAVAVTGGAGAGVASILGVCQAAEVCFDFTAAGLVPGETVRFEVEVGADQLAAPLAGTVDVAETERDVDFRSSYVFSFEPGAQGWEVVTGTFGRSSVNGGADGSTFYLASSDFQPNRCDQVLSPRLRLTPTSTLSLESRFDIEPFFTAGAVWYDRANVGLHRQATGERVLIEPDGGRPYNAAGAHGSCGTEGQGGWAGDAPAWEASTWSAAALDAAALAGEEVRLDVRYGTDPGLEGFGFHLDEVVLTDVELVVDDAAGDLCVDPSVIFGDGFEGGSTTAWSACAGCP